jgi:hypothetical protein
VLKIAAMGRSRLAWSVLSAIGMLSAFADVAAAEPRAVLELFTSQGCSSCPSADRLVGELAGDRTLVTMSLPIDYWDYLGWRDTLARPRHTARQRGYASVRGDRKVYTPQVVVNGVAHVVGSDRNAIEEAIARAHGQGTALSIPIRLTVEDSQLTVDIQPRKETEAAAEVWLLTMAKAIPVAIKRGENRGRTVTYNNVVRRWVKLGVWNGGQQNWKIPNTEFYSEEVDQVAVFVQAGGVENPGPMLGAAIAPLR